MMKLLELPFSDKYLDLCHSNYDLSFFVVPKLSLLLLVTCLEILYHPGDKDELKNRIARNAAVFLGRDRADSSKIFDDIRSLYDLRSSLVHSGEVRVKKKLLNDSELIPFIVQLRSIMSKSIIKYKTSVVDKNVSREKYFIQLNEGGFGDDPLSKR